MKFSLKKLITASAFVLTILLNHQIITALEPISQDELKTLEDSLFNDWDNPDFDNDENGLTLSRARKEAGATIPCQDILNVLTALDLQNILKKDLYKHTNPLQVRSVLDYPYWYFFQNTPHACRMQASLFYDTYNKGYYVKGGKESTYLSSYINFSILSDIIAQAAPLIAAITPLSEQNLQDVETILNVFKKFKAEERRGGIMFGGQHRHPNLYIRWFVPLLYTEHNINLTPEEQEQIEASPLFDDFDPLTDDKEELEKFKRQHLIADRIGIGDTRFTVGYHFHEGQTVLLNGGAEFTFPTAFAFRKGIYGNHFPKNNVVPSLDLSNLSDILNKVKNFGIGSIDQLTSNLLDRGLGNDGHIGLALFFEPHMELWPGMVAKARGAVEYLTPGNEKRFYIHKKIAAEFDRDYDNPELCPENLSFLVRQLYQTFYPTIIDTTIHPGVILKITANLDWQIAPHWTLSGGYDAWWKSEEKIGNIHGVTPAQAEMLRTDIAKKPSAYSLSNYALLGWHKEKEDTSYLLQLFAGGSFDARGIGQDLTMGFRFEVMT